MLLTFVFNRLLKAGDIAKIDLACHIDGPLLALITVILLILKIIFR